MLESNKEKEISKADMKKKVEAWKTINSVLVSANAEYVKSLRNVLIEKETQKNQMEEKIKNGKATEEDNAEYLYLGGYVQCLKDILNAKKESN